MENVLLIILLILALSLIAVVLLQRSEGGGLGIGGGGGGGVMSARGAASALHKVTWGLGIAFLVVSMAMTVVSRLNSDATSVIDKVGAAAPSSTTAPATTPATNNLMPPGATDSGSTGTATTGSATTGSSSGTGTTAPADAPATPPRAN